MLVLPPPTFPLAPTADPRTAIARAPSAHRPPSLGFRCASALAALAHRGGLIRPELDADRLTAWAARRTGLSDWGDGFGQEALQRLLSSARDDANLTPLGACTLDLAVRSALCTWLRQVDACREDPHKNGPLDRPIAVIGLPRSATTRLHHLLAAHPDSMYLPLWLALTPTRPPTAAQWRARGGFRRRWPARQVAAWLNAAAPSLEDIHAYGPDLPVEDTHLTFTTFHSNQWGGWPLYSYFEWLGEADAAGPYRALRRHLRLLQSELPGRHWVLKSPGHFARLGAFAREFPEALLVVMHRDPLEVFASLTSLMSAHFAPLAHGADLPRFERAVLELFARGADDYVSLRKTDPHRIVDVHTSDLHGDLLPLAEVIARRAGLRWDGEVEAAMRAHVPTSRPGQHRYPITGEPSSVARIRDRFAAYVASAGIEPR